MNVPVITECDAEIYRISDVSAIECEFTPEEVSRFRAVMAEFDAVQDVLREKYWAVMDRSTGSRA